MAAERLFLARMEVTPFPGCKLVPGGECGYLEGLVPARSRAEAEAGLREALARDRYELVALRDLALWDERGDDPARLREAARRARGSGEAILGWFR